jgi:tetratricopeptide (TPR) repeat protein
MLDRDAIQARLDKIAKRDYLSKYGGNSPEALTSLFLLSDADLRRYASGANMNTDNVPLLEFWAPRSLYANYCERNFDGLLDARSSSLPPREQMSGFALDGPEGAAFHVTRGWAYKRRQSNALALSEFKRAAELDANSVDAQVGLAYTHTDDRKPYIGLRHGREAVGLDPESAEAYGGLAYAQWNLFDFEHAITNFETALKLDPDDEACRKQLGSCRDEAKRYGTL